MAMVTNELRAHKLNLSTDPSLFNHDSGSMSWENHDVDMSQFDLGQFDAMLNGMQENSQINLVRCV